ncbi:unnamed protein product [Rotaria magnacalcarata]
MNKRTITGGDICSCEGIDIFNGTCTYTQLTNYIMADASLLALPVELIHRILNNLDACFIIFSFRKVCKRFYEIVNLYDQYKLNFDSISQSRLKIISRFIQPEKITSLVLLNMCYKSEKIKIFLSFFDTSRLTRIQSITLGLSNQANDSQVLQHLNISNLVSLNIRSTSNCPDKELPFVSKVMVQSRFRKLCLAESHYNIMTIPWPDRCTITFLTIKSCSLKEYNFLLQRLPYLQTFIITEFVTDRSNQLNSLPSVSAYYSQLISLMILNSSLSITEFESILSLTPSLVKLKLISYRSNFDSITNGSDWEYLIRNTLSSLRTFEFFFSYTLRKGTDTEDLTLMIDRFRTSFWLQEKNWIITCDYLLARNTINFYTTPTCPKDFEKKMELMTWMYHDSPCIIRFKSLPMDNEFNSTIYLVRGADDAIQLQTIRRVRLVFRNNTTLTSISLRDNQIGINGAKCFSNGLKENSTIRNIDLENNGIGEDGAIRIAEVIESIKTLTGLSLGKNQIGIRGAKYLSNALQQNMIINHVYLEDNQICDEGVGFLAEALKSHTTLVSLHLGSNKIGITGTQYLSNVLRNNTKIRRIYLENNEIADEGVQFLSEALANNEELNILDLSDNKIGDQGALYMGEALREHMALRVLNLSSNEISAATADHFYESFQNKNKLVQFDLKGNEECDAVAMEGSLQIRNDKKTIALDLRSNKIGDKGAKYIAHALQNNTVINNCYLFTLKRLRLTDNRDGHFIALETAACIKEFQATVIVLKSNWE